VFFTRVSVVADEDAAASLSNFFGGKID